MYKDEQLDDILAKKEISIAVLSETKKQLQGRKMIQNYMQFYLGVRREIHAKAGVVLMIHKKFQNVINDYSFWDERIIQLLKYPEVTCL